MGLMCTPLLYNTSFKLIQVKFGNVLDTTLCPLINYGTLCNPPEINSEEGLFYNDYFTLQGGKSYRYT